MLELSDNPFICTSALRCRSYSTYLREAQKSEAEARQRDVHRRAATASVKMKHMRLTDVTEAMSMPAPSNVVIPPELDTSTDDLNATAPASSVASSHPDGITRSRSLSRSLTRQSTGMLDLRSRRLSRGVSVGTGEGTETGDGGPGRPLSPQRRKERASLAALVSHPGAKALLGVSALQASIMHDATLL